MQTRRPDARIRIAAALGLAAVVPTALLVSRSSVLDEPGVNALLRTLILAAAVTVAAVTWSLRPRSRLGPVLMGIGLVFATTTLQAFPEPLLYTVGRLMLPVCGVLLLYAFLAFPSGQLEDSSSRRVMAVAALATGAAWLLTIVIESPLPQNGVLSRCQAACPDNPFQFVTATESLSAAADLAVAGAQALGSTLVAIMLLARMRRGTPVERVTLSGAAVPLSVLALGYVLAFVLQAAGDEQAAADLGWLYAPLFVVIPLAFLIGQVRGRLFAGAALRRMLSQLGPHPSPAAMEEHMAAAFGDPSLRVAYRAVEGEGYIDASGAALAVPALPAVGVAELWDDGERVAVILHDPALDDVPGLMAAAGAATLLAVRNARLSAELRSSIRALRASRARIAAAVDGARRELEHELAEGAQLQLASVRARLAAAVADEGDPALRDLLVELGTAADLAAETLDDAAHGIYPRQLVDRGLAAALRAALGNAPTIVETGVLSRGSEESEAAVFFSCLEAAQNALKHADAQTSVTVTLRQQDGELRFAVHDDGVGFDVGGVGRRPGRGRGLANIHDRIEAVGGHVTIVSRPALGTTVAGSVPWTAARPQAGVPAVVRDGHGTAELMRQPSDPFV